MFHPETIVVDDNRLRLIKFIVEIDAGKRRKSVTTFVMLLYVPLPDVDLAYSASDAKGSKCVIRLPM